MIDTHIHLDFSDFEADLDNVLNESKMCGIDRFIIPGASLSTLPNAFRLASEYSEIYYALGIHPNNIDEIMESNVLDSQVYQIIMQKFSPFLESKDSKKCVAIGECGLDYFYLPDSLESSKIESIKNAQKCVFEAQINIALKLDLPLILHVRDGKENDNASKDVSEILKKYYKFKNLKGVFHCFNANANLLEFSDRFYYGIGGIVTFKNAKNLVEILPQIPKDRILLETDAPYLAPIPHRGKRNESKYIPHILDKLSEILNIDSTILNTTTTQNARRLFNIN